MKYCMEWEMFPSKQILKGSTNQYHVLLIYFLFSKYSQLEFYFCRLCSMLSMSIITAREPQSNQRCATAANDLPSSSPWLKTWMSQRGEWLANVANRSPTIVHSVFHELARALSTFLVGNDVLILYLFLILNNQIWRL